MLPCETKNGGLWLPAALAHAMRVVDDDMEVTDCGFSSLGAMVLEGQCSLISSDSSML